VGLPSPPDRCEHCFDITRDNSSKYANEILDLFGGSVANGIGNTLMVPYESLLFGERHVLRCETYHTINADLVDSTVDAQKIDKFGQNRDFEKRVVILCDLTSSITSMAVL